MTKLNSLQLESIKGGLSCSKAILSGFFLGMLAGAESGAAISAVGGPQALAAGIVLGGTIGAISGSLTASATACK